MCHGFSYRADDREETEEADAEPSFLNEEADTDVELVTDGGDDEE